MYVYSYFQDFPFYICTISNIYPVNIIKIWQHLWAKIWQNTVSYSHDISTFPRSYLDHFSPIVHHPHSITEENVNIRFSEILNVSVFSRRLLEGNCMHGFISIENISFLRNCDIKTTKCEERHGHSYFCNVYL